MFKKCCLILSLALFVSDCTMYENFDFFVDAGEFVSFEPKPSYPINGKIVGGFPIDITQVPWQASVQIRESHFCGASIISQNWLLTAAHCTAEVSNARDLAVRIGSSEKAKSGSIHRVKRIVQHKKFSSKTIDYDFSLLELEDRVQSSEKTRAVTLIRKDQNVKDNTPCLVTGWGITQSPDSNKILRGVEVPIFNQQKCNNVYSKMNGITPRMLCAGFDRGGKDACQEDSGGPLVFFDSNKNATLIGVVSWGYGCANPRFPGVYARVSAVRDWILENTGI